MGLRCEEYTFADHAPALSAIAQAVRRTSEREVLYTGSLDSTPADNERHNEYGKQTTSIPLRANEVTFQYAPAELTGFRAKVFSLLRYAVPGLTRIFEIPTRVCLHVSLDERTLFVIGNNNTLIDQLDKALQGLGGQYPERKLAQSRGST
jgi:hypothetical protein